MARGDNAARQFRNPDVTVRLLRLLSGGLLVNILLLAPGWAAGGSAPRAWLAPEAIGVVGLLALGAALPSRRRRNDRAAIGWLGSRAALMVAGLVLASVLLLVADLLIRQSLARPLNLYLDLALASALVRLLVGTLGPAGALGAGLLTVAASTALLLTIARLAPRAASSGARPSMAAFGTLSIALAAAGIALPTATLGPRIDRPLWRLGIEQARALPRTLGERERFAREAAARPDREQLAGPAPLDRLEGADVIVGFVESYGLSAVDDPRYAPAVRPRLARAEARLAAAGIHLVTGALVAPSQGGQSWLGHGSLLSGLWLDNQLRYDLLLSEAPTTLLDDFRAAGYRSAALMPAITLAWPEGERLGYDRIWTFHDIDYAGPALNWVTMPDQFTWSFLERRIRPGDDPRPLFAEIGLISSHAPWTPILELEDWETIGDGEIFEPWRDAGEAPAELWRDHDRVREHYARSVGYALDAAFGWAERAVDEHTLAIVLGDHQPAPMVTGEGATRAVPVHVIARGRSRVEPFLRWGFVPGALPPVGAEHPRMDEFRSWFLRAFSSGPESGQ